jgi:hypothetical protein
MRALRETVVSRWRRGATLLAGWALIGHAMPGCAEVPKESVVLSATVGRDLEVVHAAHRELLRLLFARMRRDVDRFVDEVYAPHQIRVVMEEQRRLAASTLPAERRQALLLAVDAAFKEGAPPELRSTVTRAMEGLVKGIHDDVESLRAELHRPLDEQEATTVTAIDRSYQQISYANSVVTGHLASVVKVEEAQDEVLADAGVSRAARGDLSKALADASDHIGQLVDKASNAPDRLDNALHDAETLKATLGALGHRLSGANLTRAEDPNGK